MADTVGLKHPLDYINCKIGFELQLSKTIIDTVTHLIHNKPVRIINTELYRSLGQ